MLLSVTEYAAKVGRTRSAILYKIQRGALPAVRVGRVWCIESDTPYTDHRVKTGEYRDWRKTGKKKEPEK